MHPPNVTFSQWTTFFKFGARYASKSGAYLLRIKSLQATRISKDRHKYRVTGNSHSIQVAISLRIMAMSMSMYSCMYGD
eukprot:COSAG01_NODE_6114_length_3843_cov_2.175481_7_plen_79_part_00